MQSFIFLIDQVLELYIWALVIAVVLSWLTAFNIINMHANRFTYVIVNFFYRITEPPLRYLRRFIPNLGGVDISPIILILLLAFVRNLMREYAI